MENAILVENVSRYGHCRSYECRKEQYGRSIDQEYDVYIPRLFGERGSSWLPVEQSLVRSEDGRFYDQITIVLLKSKERRTVFFDITAPFMALVEQQKKSLESPRAEERSSEESRHLIHLMNGNTLEGTVTAESADKVSIDVPDVGTVELDRSEIASIVTRDAVDDQ